MTEEELLKSISNSKYFVDSAQNSFNYLSFNTKLPQFSYYQHHLFSSKPHLAKHYQELLVALVQCGLQKENKIDWVSIAFEMNG